MKNRISMPTGTAGITRYFDEYKSKLVVKPGYVIVMAVALVIIVFLINVIISSYILP